MRGICHIILMVGTEPCDTLGAEIILTYLKRKLVPEHLKDRGASLYCDLTPCMCCKSSSI